MKGNINVMEFRRIVTSRFQTVLFRRGFVSRSALHARYRNERGRHAPGRVEAAITEATQGLDVRWWYGRPDLSETPLGYKNADRIAAQIESFGFGTHLRTY